MKKVIRYIIKRACTLFLGECYILITCSKQVDKNGQPLYWHANTNLAKPADSMTVSKHVFEKFTTVAKINSAIEEVNHLLTVKK